MRLLMTALFLNSEHNANGFSHTWAGKLAERVEKLYVVALSVGRHELPANTRVLSMGRERGISRPAMLLNFHRHVAPLVLGGHVDGVFVQQAEYTAIMAAPYTKLRGVPMVLFKAHSRSLRPSLRVANVLIDRALTSTPAAYPIDTPKKMVTGQGIDVDFFAPPASRPSEDGRKRVVSVGRISPIKRIETQIEAARILAARGRRDFRLHVYGHDFDPAYGERLRAMTAGYGLQDFVRFEGPLEYRSIPVVYRGAHLLVHTCDTESLDKVVLEAMACEVPAITSIQAYAPEIGPRGEQLVVPIGDAERLADRMAWVLDMDPPTHQALGRELRARVVALHSVDGFADRVVQILTDLRAGRTPYVLGREAA